jgi:carboxyl-terminal processing protease
MRRARRLRGRASADKILGLSLALSPSHNGQPESTHLHDMPANEYRWTCAALLLAIGACGGGGSGGGAAGGGAVNWTPGVFSPASSFVAQCAAPRAGIDPDTGQRYPDRQGSRLTENHWLRSWSNDTYLWYDEIVDRDPAQSTTPAYFDLLRTTATTASGQPKDRFHFRMTTAQWRALAQSGTAAGYGAAWAILASTPPRDIRVAYTEPNSPATSPSANLARGARVLAIDGVSVDTNSAQGVDILNAGLFPDDPGEAHTFTIRDHGAVSDRTITMTSANVTTAPVQHVKTIDTDHGRFGYLLFNDHIATAEQALINAFTALQSATIDELIVDLRYNSGGYLVIASQLAYQIAGPVRTAGRTFELTRFNRKHPTTDPVTRQPITPMPFADAGVGLSAPSGFPLPALGLGRVFVLTGADTCSASESVVNGLRGIGVDVVLIGGTTCGKPYGFYPTDNCGTTYFTIQFRGENAAGFGDYTDGFTPTTNAPPPVGTRVTGCYIQDDFAHALGDPEERRLAVALAYPVDGCPVGILAAQTPAERGFVVAKPPPLRGKSL